MAEDGHQWSFHPQRDPLPGQRRADADLLVGQADQAGGVDGAVHLDHRPGAGGQRRGACGAGAAGGQPGQLSDPEPGWKGLDPGTVQQHMQADRIDPEGDLPPGQGGAEPDLLAAEPQFPDGGTTRSTSTADWPALRRCSAVALPPPAGWARTAGRALVAWLRLARARRELGRDAQLQQRGCGAEPGGGEGHRQRLVRTVGVVLLPPGVQRGLQRLDAFKRPVDVEQLALQGLGRVGRAARCQLGWSFS